ncbi:hypothetical protein RWH45_11860 [Microbacterium sp. KSW4-17]|uniref:DUF998 domain-containing protein n=1 Tax=Microbacterium galbum TaxID=3075994 RepID=A0ABU3T943_9MICO|nr:hypothetical protein [Microbacterium sp. KSW4-17]MDU0367909.1 hypothetical protein [Microbacterium sp. KSW4-17]
MGQHPTLRRLVGLALSVLLVGTAIWVTWESAGYWASCANASRTTMSPACWEAITSYEYAPLVEVWAVLGLAVVAAVIAKVLPGFSARVFAIAAVVTACPLVDGGFFWVDWGSADGIPGHGIWTACWLAVTGMVVLFSSSTAAVRTSERADDRVVTAAEQPRDRTS